MHHNPRRIFRLPEQPDTYIEVNLDEKWTIPEAMAYSKSRWTPFAGMEVQGKLKRVVLRGELVLVDGKVLAQPGFGQDVRTWKEKAISIKIPGKCHNFALIIHHQFHHRVRLYFYAGL